MKQITAVVRPEKAEAVRTALEAAGIPGLMVSEIEGHGKQKGKDQKWRGEKYRMELLPKMKLEVIVEDADVEKIVSTILKAAKTGKIGDGKIFISNVDNVIRIRSGEEGSKAI
jgi:nitrogen regulatory protein P-II 1